MSILLGALVGVVGSIWSFTFLQEKLAFTTQKPKLMIHVRDKLCDFIHYNVYYVTFMVTYSTQKICNLILGNNGTYYNCETLISLI
jgi:hypothetical protein